MKKRYQVKLDNNAEITYETPFGNGKSNAALSIPNFTLNELIVYDGFSLDEARQVFAQHFQTMTGLPFTNQVPTSKNKSTKFCDIYDPNAICHIEVVEQRKNRMIPIARTILMVQKENRSAPLWNSMIEPTFFAQKKA